MNQEGSNLLLWAGIRKLLEVRWNSGGIGGGFLVRVFGLVSMLVRFMPARVPTKEAGCSPRVPTSPSGSNYPCWRLPVRKPGGQGPGLAELPFKSRHRRRISLTNGTRLAKTKPSRRASRGPFRQP